MALWLRSPQVDPLEIGDAQGSAIFSLNGRLEVFHSTIANNLVFGTGGGLVYYQSEDPLPGHPFLLVNTIVANNLFFDARGNQYRNDCGAFAQREIVSGAGNLVMTGQCPGVVTTLDQVILESAG